MNSMFARNVPKAYSEAIIKMRMWAEEEDSRNGPVMTSPAPVFLEIYNPMQRVLFDPVRNANPFFHVMEFVWMITGSNDVRWIEQFNKGFRGYADPDTDTMHGAYGHRWLLHFGHNQIQRVADMLIQDASTRRAVISMWDPRVDLSSHNDLPCNTSLMFRFTEEDGLCMTVINRSNDLIWGMLGANAVHMTYLHELMCHMTGLAMGAYRVFTNNLHVYKNMPNYENIWKTYASDDRYARDGCDPYPLLRAGETYAGLVEDCLNIVAGDSYAQCKTHWGGDVAAPMCAAYLNKDMDDHFVELIQATDWRIACLEWLERNRKGK